MATLRRLPAAERRDTIVDAGARSFAARPFEDVRMDEIADGAGVSRALLYRHFASKSELFTAVYQAAVGRRLTETAAQAALPLVEQLTSGLDAHLDYFIANRNTVLAANREMSGDPAIKAIIADEFGALRDRLLATVELQQRPRDAAGALLMSWLVFVQVLCVEWLSTPTFTRDALRNMCVGALLGALDELPRKPPS